MDLYKACIEAGIPVDHHESTLYVKVTPESRILVEKYGLVKATTFTDNIEGCLWFDVPFAYTPFWEKNGTEI